MAQKTYEVVGGRKFMGHEHGEEFKAKLTEAQEERAVTRGAIKVKAEKKDSADKEKE